VKKAGGVRREAREKMNKRITLWLLATLFLTTLSLAEAQQPNISRIGILMGGSRSIVSGHLQAFKQRLQELGYVEGKTSSWITDTGKES
jgi:hypothetical protein